MADTNGINPIPEPQNSGAVPAVPAQPVLIGGVGLPQHKLDFEPGVSVGQWLRRADIALGHGQMANVGGERVDLDRILMEGEAITVASRVANGA